jgi:hypothetical protein
MIKFMQWFWSNISFTNWTFENRKLAPLLTILRKLLLIPFLYVIACIYCLTLILYNFSTDEAADFWDTI